MAKLPKNTIFFLLLLNILVFLSYSGILAPQLMVEKYQFEHDSDYSYIFPIDLPSNIPHFISFFFTAKSDKTNTSKLVLYENGSIAGSAHVFHDDVRNRGNGNYLHWSDKWLWNTHVYFSTSDNTDPNTNNRQYIIKYPLTVRVYVLLFSLSLLFLSIISFDNPILAFVRKSMPVIRVLFFFIGIFLIIINITGLFISLRNDEIYQEENTGFKNDITITEEQLYDVINNSNIKRELYLVKLTEAVNKGIAHYWSDEGIGKYNLRIPVYENYLLYLAGIAIPRLYQKYEYVNYKKAIERGVGLCSQQAIIVSEILREKGIKSQLIGLAGHVVVAAEVDEKVNKWWVLDPDYGVVIKRNIDEIENDTRIIEDYYAKNGFSRQTIASLRKKYGKKGNFISTVKEYNGSINKYVSLIKYYIEYISYILIWFIPLFFMAPYCLKLRFNRHSPHCEGSQ